MIWKKKEVSIPQHLLVVVGSRHYAPEIRQLLWQIALDGAQPVGPVIKSSSVKEQTLKHDCRATLILEPDNEYDPNAISVLVEGNTVGYISRKHNLQMKKYLTGQEELDCTVFWNGNPEDAYQFYTVQLFA